MDEVLPLLAVPAEGRVEPDALFGSLRGDLVLEIGFGGGEHLAAEAQARPEDRFIGCEPFVNGVAKLLAEIDRTAIGNVRVWPDDVSDLLRRLPDGCLDGVFLLYPDPWPKRRQRKRRLLSDMLLERLARVMRPGAELRFATDIDDYAGWALARVFRSASFVWSAERESRWSRPWPGWEATRYEAKAQRENRLTSYLTFRRI